MQRGKTKRFPVDGSFGGRRGRGKQEGERKPAKNRSLWKIGKLIRKKGPRGEKKKGSQGGL